MLVKSTQETIDILNNKIDTEKRFAYLKFGDGEIQMMEGWEGYKLNHLNSDELQAELLEAFKIEDDNYLISIGCGAKNEEGMEKGIFARFENDKDLQSAIKANSDREVYLNADSLSYLALFKQKIFTPFWDKVRSKKVMVVGGKHLKEIKSDYYVQTPSTQAYSEIDKFYPEIIKNINDVDIILFGVGVCSTVIQKRLWQEQHQVITLDIGSLFDGMLGIKSRTWISKKFNELQVLKEY